MLTYPETARRPRRVSPLTNEVTALIISPPPASAAPLIAPDIPVAIDPGPVLGVTRDALTGSEVEADRAATDPAATDATAPDQVRALHRTPRHVVLVFSGRRVALFEGHAGHLSSAAGTSFPLDLPALDGPAPESDVRSALAAVDRALGGYLSMRPAPVVLAGPQTLVAAFWSASRNLARLAGTVYGGFGDAPTAELERRTRPVLDRYLDAHRHAALALLQDRAGDRRVVSGITSVWQAARTQQPETLLVEDGYTYRARRATGSDTVTSGHDATSSEAVDDLVDDLIRTVLTRGGSIVLAPAGALPEHGKVALTLR